MPHDASQIAQIHVKTWQYAYKGQIPDSYLDSLSIEKRSKGWKKQIQNAKEKDHVFVAEINGRIVGWCTAGASRDENAMKEAGELQGIYIDPNYIGKGIGSKLMKHALNTLRQEGYKTVTLWVLETNKKTRMFYEKKGWTVEGKTKIDTRDSFDLHEIRYILGFV